MAESLTLYQLPPSPNNVMVRVALGLKGLPYESIPITPDDDRSRVVEISGQPLTPVLVHGDRVVFDSSAILRYLDANFRDTTPIFSSDYQEMKQIEGWERWGRANLVEPFGIALGQIFSEGDPDLEEMERASGILNERTARIEEALADGEWLVGDRITAADVTCGVYPWYGMLTEAVLEVFPPARLLVEHLHLGEGRERTRAWVERVMGNDS